MDGIISQTHSSRWANAKVQIAKLTCACVCVYCDTGPFTEIQKSNVCRRHFATNFLSSMFNALKRKEKLWKQEIRWHTNSLQLNKLSSEGLSYGHIKYCLQAQPSSPYSQSMRLCLHRPDRSLSLCAWLRSVPMCQQSHSTHWQTNSLSVKQILNRTTIRSNKNLYHFTQVSFCWVRRILVYTKHFNTKAFHALAALTFNYVISFVFFCVSLYIQFYYALIHSDYISLRNFFSSVQSNSFRNPFKIIAIYIFCSTSSSFS